MIEYHSFHDIEAAWKRSLTAECPMKHLMNVIGAACQAWHMEESKGKRLFESLRLLDVGSAGFFAKCRKVSKGTCSGFVV